MVAEKNSVCRLIGSFADDFADVVDEPMSSMRSASSEHQELDLAELEAVALHEIEQAPGVGHQASTPA